MSSPNEPGHIGPGDGTGNGNGSVDRSAGGARPGPSGRLTDSGPPTARIADSAEVPPWQRGAGRTQQSGPHQPPARQDPPRPAAHSPEARPNRYIAGTAAPGVQPPAPVAEPEAPARADAPRTKEYGSELPDLSGPVSRPVQARRSSPERTDAPAAGTNRNAGGARVQVAGRSKSGPVRATMQIRRVDPWSALKVSLLLSVALFFVWMIAVAFLYLVLGGMGVWSKLNSNVGDLLTSSGGSGGELVSSGTIFGGALLIGLVNIVLLTAMATIGAFIYNLTTDIVGGIEVTLADRD
ncbi:DUF3566 domain-containing protein [Mycolicibacterium komossense]|uniref:DUF3566 domain-containing protein n=1 Tax=Mycolicibacterium komossense TaxID=1779 RepID=A0ABT3C5F0_9MYCO|nr:DUF3566 domain-containing protein [Mycolicibacterium komossense]MCV7224690.1 DUF3566 domain-containing protein [Mycolicibacterium komossense]